MSESVVCVCKCPKKRFIQVGDGRGEVWADPGMVMRSLCYVCIVSGTVFVSVPIIMHCTYGCCSCLELVYCGWWVGVLNVNYLLEISVLSATSEDEGNCGEFFIDVRIVEVYHFKYQCRICVEKIVEG